VDGFHIESMAQDKGEAFAGTEIGEPVPGEDTFEGDYEILAIGDNDAQEGCGRRREILMDENRAGLIEDTDLHRPRR